MSALTDHPGRWLQPVQTTLAYLASPTFPTRPAVRGLRRPARHMPAVVGYLKSREVLYVLQIPSPLVFLHIMHKESLTSHTALPSLRHPVRGSFLLENAASYVPVENLTGPLHQSPPPQKGTQLEDLGASRGTATVVPRRTYIIQSPAFENLNNATVYPVSKQDIDPTSTQRFWICFVPPFFVPQVSVPDDNTTTTPLQYNSSSTRIELLLEA